ncbi:MAG: carboxypeptidase regulatory-like domain-containing protein [Betaproteobacteria bacterium]
MNRTRAALATSLVVLVLGAAAAHAAPESQVRQSGDISYISGGVSEEARDNLLAMGRDFNIKLILATKAGAYLSDVGIVVSAAGGRPVLDVKSEGPWFYAKLPAGTYVVEAISNGATMRRNVTIGAQGMSQIDFRWDE